MHIALRILFIFGLLFAAMICAFGFLSTFQPMPGLQRFLLQLLWGGGGVVCMFTIMRLAVPRTK